MDAPTLLVYLKQFRSAVKYRPQATVRWIISVTNHKAVLKGTLDSPIQNDDLQRWNDDGGHGRHPRKPDSTRVPA